MFHESIFKMMHSLFPRSSGETAEDKLQCCCQHGAGRHRAPQCQSPFCHGRDSPRAHGAPLGMGGLLGRSGGHTEHTGFMEPVKIYSNFGCKQPQRWKKASISLGTLQHAPCSMSLPGLEIWNIPHWQQDCLYPHSTQTINASLSSPNSCQRSWSFWATGLTHRTPRDLQECSNTSRKDLFQ